MEPSPPLQKAVPQDVWDCALRKLPGVQPLLGGDWLRMDDAFDAQMATLITDSWEHARTRDENYLGYGNLPVLAELHVQWAPYARPKHEHSIPEDGLQVPINSEVSPKTARWLQSGRKTIGTIVNRASMFDLHRTHVKKLRVSSYKQQLYKGILEAWGEVQKKIETCRTSKALKEDDPHVAKLEEHVADLETLMIGMKSVLLDDAKLEVAMHLMTTVMLRDGVLCNTDVEEEVARQIRFHDTYGARLMMNPVLVSASYSDDEVPPPEKDDPPRKPLPMSARKIRKNIVNEMGNAFAGKPPPDLPHMPGELRDATQSYELDTGVTIPAASPHSGGALTPSRIYEKQVIYAIAYAVAARFETERREAEKRQAAEKAAEELKTMPEGSKKRCKREFPDAIGSTTRLKEFLKERERKKRHDRRDPEFSPHVSPEPVSTVTQVTGPSATATATATASIAPTVPVATTSPPAPMINTPPMSTRATIDWLLARASPQERADMRARLAEPDEAPAPAPSHTSSSRKRRNEQAASEAASVPGKRGTRARATDKRTTREQVPIDPVSDDDAMSAPCPTSGQAADGGSPTSSE